MTKLECSVKNCMHNSDNYCCKSAILVDGNEAVKPNETCCASFDENKGGAFTNRRPAWKWSATPSSAFITRTAAAPPSASTSQATAPVSADRPAAPPLRPAKYGVMDGNEPPELRAVHCLPFKCPEGGFAFRAFERLRAVQRPCAYPVQKHSKTRKICLDK